MLFVAATITSEDGREMTSYRKKEKAIWESILTDIRITKEDIPKQWKTRKHERQHRPSRHMYNP
ncbi:hypothetical protein V1477_011520 [Vespula maculifrons]|uniref:Uncharacterized protein n=1 Tax=Vespula maculifrons TaxID=7453 RepID=A0ABD2BZE9_VESMC